MLKSSVGDEYTYHSLPVDDHHLHNRRRLLFSCLVKFMASDPIGSYHHNRHRLGHLRILHLLVVSNDNNVRFI
jgi:hypothetical protein